MASWPLSFPSLGGQFFPVICDLLSAFQHISYFMLQIVRVGFCCLESKGPNYSLPPLPDSVPAAGEFNGEQNLSSAFLNKTEFSIHFFKKHFMWSLYYACVAGIQQGTS